MGKVTARIDSMYVGKNVGYSRRSAESYERIFGKGATSSASSATAPAPALREATFSEGPLGLEIIWTTPPVVCSVLAGGQAHREGIKVGQIIMSVSNRSTSEALPEPVLEELMQQRPLHLTVSNGCLAPEVMTRVLAGAQLEPEASDAE